MFPHVPLSRMSAMFRSVLFILTVIMGVCIILSLVTHLSTRTAGVDGDISSVYYLPEVFQANFQAMSLGFKVYIYQDGDSGTFYHTPRTLTGKYASEGYFFQNIRESNFLTEDPDKADMFFIPISVHKMLRGKGISNDKVTKVVRDYVDSLIMKYPYWNRTLGVDHFFVSCHEVGVRATEGIAFLVKNAIRVVCSPRYDTGFIPHKDVSLPRMVQPFILPAGGNDAKNRTMIGFWAGEWNSKLRETLARVWGNGSELDIMNAGLVPYQERHYYAKFCICPGGNILANVRIFESIHSGCIPVILSEYYQLPFDDVLDWKKFSLTLKEGDVYNLEHILKNISDAELLSMQNNLVMVQKHFQWNSPPVKYDTFHMVMFELWLRHRVTRY